MGGTNVEYQQHPQLFELQGLVIIVCLNLIPLVGQPQSVVLADLHLQLALFSVSFAHRNFHLRLWQEPNLLGGWVFVIVGDSYLSRKQIAINFQGKGR